MKSLPQMVILHLRNIEHPLAQAVTILFLRSVNVDSFKETWHAGVAWCSKRDTFCRATGRELALSRVMDHLTDVDGVLPGLYVSMFPSDGRVRRAVTHLRVFQSMTRVPAEEIANVLGVALMAPHHNDYNPQVQSSYLPPGSLLKAGAPEYMDEMTVRSKLFSEPFNINNAVIAAHAKDKS